MTLRSRVVGVAAVLILAVTGVALPAVAAAGQPAVTGLSVHRAPYWGGTTVTVSGTGFTDLTGASTVSGVLFGTASGYGVHVLSPTTLTVVTPSHRYGAVTVRVVTAAGMSAKGSAATLVYGKPTMDDPIQGGLSAHQEQRASFQARAHHRSVKTARAGKGWTAAMGVTAVKRAQSWLGIPYSWDGGSTSAPTRGACSPDGGDFDCLIVGFDCSGLALYSWGPYRSMSHYAQTQYKQAGRFHPSIGQLVPGDLVFFSGYLPNGIGHVAVYAGNGMVIEAEQSGTLIHRARLTDVIASSGQYRGATRPVSTGRQSSGPTVSGMTTQLPASGGTVTITGSGFSTATTVAVGSTMIYSFARRTSNTLVVRLPAHQAGSAKVTVSNPWGSASRSVTYTAAPALSSITPSQGPISGGTSVTLTGTNLASVTQLSVDSASVPYTVVSPTQIMFTTPAHLTGTVPVVVTSAWGTSNPESFTYTLPVGASPSPSPSGSSTSGSSPGAASPSH